MPPKQIKGEHIKKKMRNIGMDQSTANETVPLIMMGYRRRVEDQIINNFLIAKTAERD